MGHQTSMYSPDGKQTYIWHNLTKMIYPGFSLNNTFPINYERSLSIYFLLAFICRSTMLMYSQKGTTLLFPKWVDMSTLKTRFTDSQVQAGNKLRRHVTVVSLQRYHYMSVLVQYQQCYRFILWYIHVGYLPCGSPPGVNDG